MKPVQEQTILVTGATDGLGKRVARDLAALKATVILHGRSRAKGEATLKEIQDATGNPGMRYYNADFSSLDAVRRFCDRILSDHERIDVLINNAGLGAGMRGDKRETGPDGFELRFTVNYLAPYVLTNSLLPLLRRSAPARIVNVASAGQQTIDFDNVMLESGYDGLRAYRQSKLALVMFSFNLAAQLQAGGITVNCLHPASLMDTKMVLETDFFSGPLNTIATGADAVTALAIAPDLQGVTGEYFDVQRKARAIPQAYDQQARQQLLALSRRLCRL